MKRHVSKNAISLARTLGVAGLLAVALVIKTVVKPLVSTTGI